MHQVFEEISGSLRTLADAVRNTSGENRTLTEAYGWNCPAITRIDLAAIPDSIATWLEEACPEKIDQDEFDWLKPLPKQIEVLKQQTVPQLFNGGNVPQASAAYMATMSFLEKELAPYYSWQKIDDPAQLPPKLARRVRGCAARLAEIEPDLGALDEKVRGILSAHDAAESLPADMEALSEARKKIDRLAEGAVIDVEKITSREKQAKEYLDQMVGKAKEASKIIDQCDEAYRAATTKGLAAAFDERAASLRESMRYWVFGLAMALAAGGAVGKNRIDALSEVFSSGTLHWETVFAHILLTVVGIGGPLWFAWVATKQIGHRFRLSEDYAFKASVAKAYEGYRREAANIDEVFEARLFSTALVRLEEAPLRLVEGTTHGSPWHEFMTSPVFEQAVAAVPNFKDTLVEIFKKGWNTTSGFTQKPAGDGKQVSEELGKAATQ
ncbi:MAG: hypothetical protein H6R14_2345 [Proteobacteria bacterium]|nr:hypothetical protein [Pseudomonadota bacterium]